MKFSAHILLVCILAVVPGCTDIAETTSQDGDTDLEQVVLPRLDTQTEILEVVWDAADGLVRYAVSDGNIFRIFTPGSSVPALTVENTDLFALGGNRDVYHQEGNSFLSIVDSNDFSTAGTMAIDAIHAFSSGADYFVALTQSDNSYFLSVLEDDATVKADYWMDTTPVGETHFLCSKDAYTLAFGYMLDDIVVIHTLETDGLLWYEVVQYEFTYGVRGLEPGTTVARCNWDQGLLVAIGDDLQGIFLIDVDTESAVTNIQLISKEEPLNGTIRFVSAFPAGTMVSYTNKDTGRLSLVLPTVAGWQTRQLSELAASDLFSTITRDSAKKVEYVYQSISSGSLRLGLASVE